MNWHHTETYLFVGSLVLLIQCALIAAISGERSSGRVLCGLAAFLLFFAVLATGGQAYQLSQFDETLDRIGDHYDVVHWEKFGYHDEPGDRVIFTRDDGAICIGTLMEHDRLDRLRCAGGTSR